MDNEEKLGHIHPLTRVIRRTNEIFSEMGFSLIDGPEIETEHYNFDALNIPKDHPARDMWDTFWLKPKSKSEIRNTKSPPVAPERSDGGRGETNSKLEIQNSKLLLRTHT
ncbi:MAG: Phenylalanine-tRNA ligase alpha subunit, partial [Parcubacteria group bacterium GW2011_GWA2_43_13]